MDYVRRGTPEFSDLEGATFSKVEDLDTDDEPSDRTGGILAGGNESDKSVSEGEKVPSKNESDKDEKSVSEGAQLEDAESGSSDAEDIREEPVTAQKQADNGENSSLDGSGSDKEEESHSEGSELPTLSRENSIVVADEEEKSVPQENGTDDVDSPPSDPDTTDTKSSASDDSGDAAFSDD